MLYKAQLGELLVPWDQVNSLLQINFIQKGYFSIAQGDPSLIQTGDNNTPTNFYNSVKAVIGNQVDSLYGVNVVNQYSDNDSSRASLKLAIPSLFSTFQIDQQTLDDGFAMYLPSLKRLILKKGSDRVYSVSDDGSLSYMTLGRVLAVGVSTESQIDYSFRNICFFVSDGEFNEETATIVSNFRVANFYSYFSYARLGITNISMESAFGALFSSFSPPDGPWQPDDPYESGGYSKPSELPPGTFDSTSDIIALPPLPTLSAANTGFTRIYNPTLAQVQDLAHYLWTDESILQTVWNKVKQYFENPMDAIIGFNLVPVPVPDGGTENFTLLFWPTNVNLTVAATQFVDVDCGTFTLERYYGSALDQSPYTKVSCFLPYIGVVQLNTDEVMGTTLQVNYRVDIVTGSCVAAILVDGSCLYQYSGHCAINIPFSSSDFSSYVSSVISIAKLGIAVGTASAIGAGAAVTGEASQQTGRTSTTTIETVNTVRNPNTNRQITDSTTRQTITSVRPESQNTTDASFAGLSPSNISNTVGQIMSSKPNINHSGSFSGNSGYLGVRRPYVIIERPRMCLPENYQSLNGYPSMITMKLGDCTGFTRVQQVQLTGLTATNPEQAEILELLKSGVVF